MTQDALLAAGEQIINLKEEYPLTVREAAKYLGVSLQTVYLWVERKQIPHPRNGSEHPVPQIGSRDIPRFLQTGDGECLDRESTTVSFIGGMARRFGGFAIEIARVWPAESPARPPIGKKRTRNSGKDFWRETPIFWKSYERVRL